MRLGRKSRKVKEKSRHPRFQTNGLHPWSQWDRSDCPDKTFEFFESSTIIMPPLLVSFTAYPSIPVPKPSRMGLEYVLPKLVLMPTKATVGVHQQHVLGKTALDHATVLVLFFFLYAWSQPLRPQHETLIVLGSCWVQFLQRLGMWQVATSLF